MNYFLCKFIFITSQLEGASNFIWTMVNRIDYLNPMLIRPGRIRIDRKIEFLLPDVKTKRHIFRYVANNNIYDSTIINVVSGCIHPK